jgi:hypothetical protein
MRGVITSKEVLTHLPTIWRAYGSRCVLRCLGAVLTAKPTTFLDVVFARSATEERLRSLR